MHEDSLGKPQVPPFWPFASFGRYRLQVVEEGTTELPWEVWADEPASLAEALRRALADDPRPMTGAAFADAERRITGYTAGPAELARGMGITPIGLFTAASLRAAAALVLFDRLTAGMHAEASPEIARYTTRMVQVGATLGVPVLDHLLVEWSEHHLALAHHKPEKGWRWPRPAPETVDWPEEAEERSLRIKFRDPRRREDRWAGVGSLPRWLLAALAEGRPLEELLAAADEKRIETELRAMARRLAAPDEDLEASATPSLAELRERVREGAARRLARAGRRHRKR